MNKPFFSIVTCTYNSEEFLQQNIKSVESQTFHDYEHIFIDGKSRDKTLKIIFDYKKNNNRVKLFSYLPKGISNAFNKGVVRSRGKYIFFLNSDDYFYDERVLEHTYSFIQKNPSADWFYGKICEVDENSVALGIFPRQFIFHKQNYWLLKLINFIPHQSVFMNKEVFIKFGMFDENIQYLMDYEYWLRVGKKTKWNYMDIIVSNYRNRKDSNSASKENYKKVMSQMLKFRRKYVNFFDKLLFFIFSYLIHTYRSIKLKDK